MIYLASPYWHPNPMVRTIRYNIVTEVAAYLMYHRRISIFSPLTQNVPIAKKIEELFGVKSGSGEELGHDFWVYTIDFPILRRCDGMMVLMLEGWLESSGVADEIRAAKAINLPIEYLQPTIDGTTGRVTLKSHEHPI